MLNENILNIAIIGCAVIIIVLLVVLLIVFLSSKTKKTKKEESVTSEDGTVDSKKQKSKTFGVESVMDFMEFDKVEDNMIVQKNGAKYVMIVECQGINYDLM